MGATYSETAKEPFGLAKTETGEPGLGQRNWKHYLGRLQSLLRLQREDQLPYCLLLLALTSLSWLVC